MRELQMNQEHPLNPLIRYYNISQIALATNLGISQAHLSHQLTGRAPMKERIETEIQELIDHLREQKKPKKIIKKRTNKMEKSKVEDKNLSTFKRPISKSKLAPKKAKKPTIKKG